VSDSLSSAAEERVRERRLPLLLILIVLNPPEIKITIKNQIKAQQRTSSPHPSPPSDGGEGVHWGGAKLRAVAGVFRKIGWRQPGAPGITPSL